MQVIDLPDTAHIAMMRRTDSQDPAQQVQDWVLIPQSDIDALLVRVVMAEAHTAQVSA